LLKSRSDDIDEAKYGEIVSHVLGGRAGDAWAPNQNIYHYDKYLLVYSGKTPKFRRP